MRDEYDVRTISGYTPKERSPEERVASCKKEIARLEFLLEAARRNLASAEKAIANKED